MQIIVTPKHQEEGRANNYMGSLGTDEDIDDDDDLLKEEAPSNWDIFDDFHKFDKLDQKLKEKKKQSAKE